MSTNQNKMTARELMARLDRRDVDGVLALCTPNAVFHGFAPQPLDPAGYRQAIGAFLSAFPDSRFPLDVVVADGDRVAIQHSLRGTHRADFQGVPPSGKAVVVPGVVIFRFESGRAAEVWLNADILGLLMQIGAVPAPESN